MAAYITAWIAAALAFLGLDALWLTQMWTRLYKPLVGEITRTELNMPASVGFYVIYISAIVFFAVAPAIERGGLGRALFSGAALGLVAYATYNLTNQATLKAWDWRVTFADMAWGVVATALAAVISYAVASRVS